MILTQESYNDFYLLKIFCTLKTSTSHTIEPVVSSNIWRECQMILSWVFIEVIKIKPA